MHYFIWDVITNPGPINGGLAKPPLKLGIGWVIIFHFLCFLRCLPQQAVEQTVELSVMWDAMTFMWGHFIVIFHISSGQAIRPWWRHQMEIFSALLAFCAGNSPVTGEFPAQRPVTRSFDVFFHVCLNKRLSKQPWGWWFETPSRSLWRHLNVLYFLC